MHISYEAIYKSPSFTLAGYFVQSCAIIWEPNGHSDIPKVIELARTARSLTSLRFVSGPLKWKTVLFPSTEEVT